MAFMAMFSGCWDLFAQTERLEIRRADEAGKRELSWLPNVPRSTGSTPLSARYQAYQSDDHRNWHAVGEPMVGKGDAEMRLILDSDASQQYYRLESAPQFQFFDKNSDTVVSYTEQQHYFYDRVESLSVEKFERDYEFTESYREQIDWDVTQAQF